MRFDLNWRNIWMTNGYFEKSLTKHTLYKSRTLQQFKYPNGTSLLSFGWDKIHKQKHPLKPISTTIPI